MNRLLSAVCRYSAGTGRLVLLAVLLAAPWAFGGAEYSDQRWIYGGVLVALGLWLLEHVLTPISAPVVPTLLVPLVAALVLGGVQILPGVPAARPALNTLPQDTAAPDQFGVKGRLPSSLRDELGQRSQISLYPASTRLELGRLTIGLAAFLAGLGLFTVPRFQRQLWLALAFNGAALACFGIVQKLSWNEKLYWQVPLTQGGQPFAAFVNRNNAAGYLNLCCGAAIGLAVWAVWKPAVNRPGLHRHRAGMQDRWGLPRPQQFLAVVLCLLILAGVCSSLSRGGTVALVLAALAVLGLLGVQRGARVAAWTAGAGALLCALLLGGLGVSRGVADRLSTLFDERVTLDSRWMNWQTAWRAVHDFPILGTGFGTYRYAYQPYQTSNANLWFYNADNQYVEGLTEGGLIGLLLLGTCLGLMVRAVWLLIRRDAGGTHEPLVYVILFAFLSQCVQAVSDYGISVPANLVTFATICGVAVGEAARRCVPRRPPWSIALPVWEPRWVLGILAVAVLLNGFLGVAEVSAAAVAKAARISLPSLTKPDLFSASGLEAAIATLEAAVRRRPQDAELRQALGELWIYRYRQQVYRRWAQRAHVAPELDAPQWNSIGLVTLSRLVSGVLRAGDRQALDDLRKMDVIRDNLQPARSHLLAARAACPVLPGIGLNLAMTDFLDDTDPAGMANLELAVALAPVNEEVLFTAGLLAEQASQFRLSEQFWAGCLAQSSRHQREILSAVLSRLTLPEAVDRNLVRSPAVLLDLARTRFAGDAQQSERRQLVQQARQLLEEDATILSASEHLYWSAVAAQLSGQQQQALAFLQQAVSEQPENIGWQMELAQTYQKAGRLDEAIREARQCARLAPHQADVAALLDELLRQQSSGAAGRRSATAAPAKESSDSSRATRSKSNSP